MSPVMVPKAARVQLRGYVIYVADLEAWMTATPFPAWYKTASGPLGADTKSVDLLLRHDVTEFQIWDVNVQITGRWRRKRCLVHVETRDPFRLEELTQSLASRKNVVIAPYECRISRARPDDPRRLIKDIAEKVFVGVLAGLAIAGIVAIARWIS